MTTLRVFFQNTHCGNLQEVANGAVQFQYMDRWIEEGRTQISVRLPVSDRVYENAEAAPFIASFLPEGESLRRRLEKLLHADAENDFALLSIIGRESAGALSFWPEDEEPFSDASRYEALSNDEFERWKAYAHQLPMQFQGRQVRLSLAGTQSKTALYFDEKDQPFIPENGAPTTHILKPRIPGCQPSTVFIELLTMRLARAVLGEARVPEVDLWNNCYRIRRFDRLRSDHGVVRVHQEDFCLALGRMPNQKYETGSPRERLAGSCFSLIDALGEQELITAPALQRQQLLDQIILNVLLHNPDAHLKNYAFLYKEDGRLEITPLYDSLCTHGLNFASDSTGAWTADAGPSTHTRELSLQIGNAVNIDEVSIEDWEVFALECGFTKAYVRRRLRFLAERASASLVATADEAVEQTPAMEPASKLLVAGIQKQLSMTSR
jgi:serine/threonine-protein kinase HipA